MLGKRSILRHPVKSSLQWPVVTVNMQDNYKLSIIASDSLHSAELGRNQIHARCGRTRSDRLVPQHWAVVKLYHAGPLLPSLFRTSEDAEKELEYCSQSYGPDRTRSHVTRATLASLVGTVSEPAFCNPKGAFSRLRALPQRASLVAFEPGQRAAQPCSSSSWFCLSHAATSR